MLKKIRNTAYQYAIPSALLIAVAFYVVMRVVSFIFAQMPHSMLTSYLDEIAGMLYPVGFVFLFGFSTAFESRKLLKGLLCGMPLIVVQLIVLISFFIDSASTPDVAWKPMSMILLGLFSVVGIGIREECIFRATIQNILAKKYANSVKGIWITAIVSAVVFGLIHMTNIIAGVEVLSALVQSFTNIGIGLFFAALYLRSGNIWVLVLIHTLTDTAGLASSVFTYQNEIAVMSALPLQSIIGGVIFVGISAFLLRPSKCEEILERFRREGVGQTKLAVSEGLEGYEG